MRLGRHPSPWAKLVTFPPHRFGASPVLASLDRGLADFIPGLYNNDIYPDCTFVSLTNAARAVAHLNGYELAIYPEMVPSGYAACVGCPNTPMGIMATDGAQMTDVLSWQGHNGFDIGPQKLVALSGVVRPNRIALAKSMAYFGTAWCGGILKDREMAHTGPGTVWDVVEGRDDGPVVGGHAFDLWSYTGLGDTDTVWVGTWGYWQAATWAWVEARVDEAHGLVWRQLARADSTFYSGLDANGLANELT